MKKRNIVISNDLDSIVLVEIPVRNFYRGTWLGDRERFPLQKISLAPIYMSETAVTQAVFEKIMGFNPSLFKGIDLPVTNISYYEAKEFCEKIQKTNEDFTFRLPTEAEWEFAARGNESCKYAGSDHIDEVAWFFENSLQVLQPVRQKKPNNFGLYDMSGNVWEWCEDWYHTRYGYLGWPLKKIVHNPTGPNFGNNKVVRGGCFLYNDKVCNIRIRSRRIAGGKCSYVGFRFIAERLK